ncbi:MAG: GNAT family N-acetyltransferase [Legionellales bacterium]|nr:GNAT family N-acetyltransferase [Legionellales bacterium]
MGKTYTAFSEIYINDIWIDQYARGKGYGRKLLQDLKITFNAKDLIISTW